MRQLHGFLLMVALLGGCARPVQWVGGEAPAPEPEPAVEAPAEAPDIHAPLDLREHAPYPSPQQLSLRERVAQLVMPWIGGEYWPADSDPMEQALRLVREQRVGGFVVGIGTSPYDLASKFNRLQRASRWPLLIAADLESGPSMRIRGGTAFPGNMAVGATGREEDAYDVGRVIAIEGRAVGIHLVFAPVVDVNSNPLNPIINTRSYGEDPRQVGRLGAAFVRGLRQHGMLATAKHFPGHGDTGTDSHVSLPVITAGRLRLDSMELVPFRMAVAADVDAVMSAHVAMPSLTGSNVPATLSPVVLDSLLRRDMRFDGLVVTDALNMGAVVEQYGAGQAAVMALRAGADILLMPTDARTAIDAVVAAIQRGEISEARLDSSVARVLSAKARAGLFTRRIVDLNAIANNVAIREHVELSRRITARSLVLVKDSLGLVPLSAERRRRVLVVTYAEEGNTELGNAFALALRTGGARVQTHRLWPASGPASYDSVRTAANGATVVFVTAPRPLAWRPDAVNVPEPVAELVNRLGRSTVPVVTVSFGSPYVLGQLPGTNAYLAAWANNAAAEQAAAAALLGTAPITGRLPVALPPVAPLGSGIQRTGGP